MELNELLTWEALGSYVGLMAVTFVVTQVLKSVVDMGTKAIRLTAIITAVVASVGFHLVTTGPSIPVMAMAVVNGLLVALATMKTVEIAKGGLTEVEPQDSQVVSMVCPLCGRTGKYLNEHQDELSDLDV